MKTRALGLALVLTATFAQAQLAPHSAPLPRHHLAALGEASESTTEPNEAELLSHHHYEAKDGHYGHSSTRSTHDQVSAGASTKTAIARTRSVSIGRAHVHTLAGSAVGPNSANHINIESSEPRFEYRGPRNYVWQVQRRSTSHSTTTDRVRSKTEKSIPSVKAAARA